ncbi:MAG: ABC transporter ATP-binding protein [Lachnospiraceae bacterium]|nr:ABC transporter ATP-binding protein [Lachnospiraceae bacterium]
MTSKDLRRQFYKGNKLAFGVAVFTALTMAILSLSTSWLIQQLMDTISGVEGALGLKTLALLTVGLICLAVVMGMVEYASKPRFMKKAIQQYKEFAFESLLKKNINTFNGEAAASYISALSNDVTSIEANYLEKQFGLITSLVMFTGAFIMMLLYSPLLTLIVVLLLILPVIASAMVGNKMEATELAVSKKNESLTDTIKEIIGGFSVVKSFKAEKAVLQFFLKSNTAVEDAKCKKSKIAILIETISSTAGITAQMGVFIAGAYLAISGKGVTPGIVMAFVNLMNFLLQPIAALPEIFASRKASVALMDKLCDLLNKNVTKEKDEVVDTLKQGITVQNLSFGYKEDEDVLIGLNLSLEEGKSYALVGASGCGKSTLLNLFLAAYDNYEGRIFYDNHELRDISSEALYDVVSVIQQNVVIFNATLRDNITMFRDIPKEEVDRVIDAAGLRTFVEEHGEDNLCGENGNLLSGGERQRISIARSLLRKVSVLLVDEATAALDKQTAYQVSNAILDIQDVMKVVITHSLEENLLNRFDEIIVLKAGEVAEKGTFEELMKKKEYFYSLYMVAQ